MRRILHVVADAQFGGAQWYLIELARIQRARGDRVTILTGGEGPLWEQYVHVADVAVRSPVMRRAVGLADAASIWDVTRQARSHDIVHAHATKALAWCALAPGGHRFVWSAHGYDSAHAEFHRVARSPAAFAKALLARRAAAVSVASLNVAAKARRAGIDPRRVRVVYTGVNAVRFGNVPPPPSPAPVTFGAAGRIVGIKGFDVLAEAAARVLRSGRDARFVLYGNGPREQALRGQIADLGIADRFDIRAPTADLPRAFAEMHVVVLPSRLDSFPLVPCEAMVAGRPVIVTRVGGLPEAIEDGVHGIIVEPDDPVTLGDAIARFVDEPERIRAMGSAARDYARRRYDWARVADEYDELYRIS